MPSPVEALPCGSRSTIRTSSPMAASAVPRLIAVVVLPTPPFWLATASTRGGLIVAASRVGSGAERSVSGEDEMAASVIKRCSSQPDVGCMQSLVVKLEALVRHGESRPHATLDQSDSELKRPGCSNI